LQLKFYGIGWEFEIGIKLVFDLDLYFNSIGLWIVSSIGLELDIDLDGKWNGLGLDISLGLEMIGVWIYSIYV
jgi:hypothetical protein